MNIREYKSSDRKAIFHINRENQYFNAPNFQKYFNKEFDKHVAVIDKLIGWLVIEPKKFYVEYIVVDPDHLGKGIGTALLAYAEVLAKKKGFSETTLDTLSDNIRAQGFYEYMGYVKTSEWTNQFGEGMYGYKKSL